MSETNNVETSVVEKNWRVRIIAAGKSHTIVVKSASHRQALRLVKADINRAANDPGKSTLLPDEIATAAYAGGARACVIKVVGEFKPPRQTARARRLAAAKSRIENAPRRHKELDRLLDQADGISDLGSR